MKIEPVTCVWMFVCAMNFWAARNGKKLNFGLFRPNLRELGLFHPYFVCKYSFREISMIKIVILDQSKPISLILKIEKIKIKKSKICKLNVYYIIHTNGNKTSIQPILYRILHLLCSIRFFVRWISKSYPHWEGGLPRVNEEAVLISSWKCNYIIYLDIQAISTLLCFLLIPFFYNTCYKNCSPEKLRFRSLQSLFLPEFWTYKDGTRFILKRNKVSIENYP